MRSGSAAEVRPLQLDTELVVGAEAEGLFPGEMPESLPEPEALRVLEALLFAATEPLDESTLARRLPQSCNVAALLPKLAETYRARGVNLVTAGGRWAFRTAPDLGVLLREERVETKRLSRAALETLAIIAYHQPATRAEIEDIRGVSTSSGTLDLLLETGWICLRGRRRTPGRPVTYGTTAAFLDQFGLERLDDLPGLDELKAIGLLDIAAAAGAVSEDERDGNASTDNT